MPIIYKVYRSQAREMEAMPCPGSHRPRYAPLRRDGRRNSICYLHSVFPLLFLCCVNLGPLFVVFQLRLHWCFSFGDITLSSLLLGMHILNIDNGYCLPWAVNSQNSLDVRGHPVQVSLFYKGGDGTREER